MDPNPSPKSYVLEVRFFGSSRTTKKYQKTHQASGLTVPLVIIVTMVYQYYVLIRPFKNVENVYAPI